MATSNKLSKILPSLLFTAVFYGNLFICGYSLYLLVTDQYVKNSFIVNWIVVVFMILTIKPKGAIRIKHIKPEEENE